MKKLILLSASLVVLNGIFASALVIQPPLNASAIYITVGNTGRMISLLDLSRIKIKDFEALTGEKMKLIRRLGFKAAQMQLCRFIDTDGTISNRKAGKFLSNIIEGQKGFHFGGFALGFFSWVMLFIGGLLVAYLIKDEKRKNRIKWAWIGFATGFLVGVILALIIGFDVAF
ncbi:MAG: hypothetical protein ACO25B_08170 [Chitinophagaceae bacterium]